MKKVSLSKAFAVLAAGAIGALGISAARADVILAPETFDSSTLPAMWSNVFSGPPGDAGQLWFGGGTAGTVDTSGLPGFAGGKAFINSDAYGSSGVQDASLVTPAMNLTGYVNVRLKYATVFRQFLSDEFGTVQVSTDGGTVWNNVVVYNASTAGGGSNPPTGSVVEDIDISAWASNQADVRVRFRYEGSFGWWWLLDGVSVEADPLVGSLVSFSSTPAPAGPSGGTLTVNVSVSPAVAADAIIDYETVDGTAVLGVDFDTATGSITVSNPDTTGSFGINLLPRTARLNNRTFTLSTISGAGSDPITIMPAGTLTITNGVPLGGGRVFGADFFGGPNEYYDFDPLNPSNAPNLITNPGPGTSLWFYGDFADDDFDNFIFTRDVGGSFTICSIDTTTFQITNGPALSGAWPANHNPRGFKWDRLTDTWFVVAQDAATFGTSVPTLGTVNPTTGAYTAVGSMGVSGINGIIISRTGDMYAFRTTTDQLYSVNKATGATTLIGSFGTDLAAFLGDGDFDDVTGEAYYSGTDLGGSGVNRWFSVNLSTGALTSISNVETGLNLGQMSALGIASGIPPGGVVSIGNVSLAEGSTGGATTFSFPISYFPAPVGNETVDWAISFGDTDAADFDAGQAMSGTFTFVGDGSSMTQFLDVEVGADFNFEDDESFTITLSNSSGPAISGSGAGTGTILNDDLGVCQNLLLSEDFSSASGQSAPAGWQNIPGPGNTDPERWRFSASTSIATESSSDSTNFDGVHARWDSDDFSASTFNTVCDLITPAMDFTTATGTTTLTYRSLFKPLGASSGTTLLSLDGGATFPTTLRTVTGTAEGTIGAGTPAFVSIDLPGSVNGVSNVRIAFRWFDPTWSWYWAIDDVEVCNGGLGDEDCNNNSMPDGQDIFNDPSLDCDGNGRIDACEITEDASLDCDVDGVLDSCEIAGDPTLDCDNDTVLDSCEIAADDALDCDENGVLDSCEVGGPGGFYVNDSGTYLDSLGTGAGNADYLALKSFTVIAGAESISELSFIIGGTPGSPVPAVVNGAPVTAVLFDDPNNDGNPTDAVALDSLAGTVTEANTGNFQVMTFTTPVNVGTAGDRFFLAYAWGTNSTDAFFCALSTDGLGTDSWLAAGPRNATTPTNVASFTSIPPTLLSGIGFERIMLRGVAANVATPGDTDANGILDECENPQPSSAGQWELYE